jgi:hypothetical protein
MIDRRLRTVILGAILLSASSCGGSLFKVKPAIELPPLADNVKTGNAGGVTIKVAPLMTDEETQELFEANLPLSGVLPLRLEMVFESGVAIETKKVRFRLRDGESREWKLISPKAAVGRILKANDIYAYNPNSRKQFEKEFAAYGIDLKEPLNSSERRHQGFIFFVTPKNEPVESPKGLVLTIEGLPQRVEIALNYALRISQAQIAQKNSDLKNRLSVELPFQICFYPCKSVAGYPVEPKPPLPLPVSLISSAQTAVGVIIFSIIN